MRRFAALAVACLGIVTAGGGSEGARAEGFVDVRFGHASTEDGDFKISGGGAAFSGTTGFDDSFTTGVRGGYWFRRLPGSESQRTCPTSRRTRTRPAAWTST